MDENPYRPPNQRTNGTNGTNFFTNGTNANRNTLRSLIALVAGMFVASMGAIAWWSSEQLFNDDFHMFFMMFLASSLSAWPAACISVFLSVWLIRDGRGRLALPLLAIELCCFGLGIIVFTWSG